MKNNDTPYTNEDWAKWLAHKSNKELWIEEQEREEAEKDD